MKISELQDYVKDRLNKVEALVQGGCKAFAEDTRSVYDESNQWISGGKVALVVVTPDMTRNGIAEDGIPMETKLMVRCVEMAPVASSSHAMRALDAAEIVGHELDGPVFNWESVRQTADERTKTITATATFNVTIHLSYPGRPAPESQNNEGE